MSVQIPGFESEKTPSTKDLLPKGPWHDEPDYDEWDVDGVKCILVRSPWWSWNGYIGIPVFNVFFHCEEGELWDYGVELHGGATWGPTREDPRPGWVGITTYWWLGFDTAHAGDYAPGLAYMSNRLPMMEELKRATGLKGAELKNMDEELLRKELAEAKENGEECTEEMLRMKIDQQKRRSSLFDGDVYRDYAYCKNLLQKSAETLAKGNMK